MSECGPNCDCDDAKARRASALADVGNGPGPSARRMNASVETFDSASEPYTVESGPFKGRVYRRNAAGQPVRQKQLERTARL